MADWIKNLVESWGYFGISLLMFLENIFPPIPSEVIMPLAGFTSTRGELSFVGVLVAGTLGSVVGQLPLYYLGRWVGADRLKEWAQRYGKWLTVSKDDIDRAQTWFDQHGYKTVLFCRFVPGLRTLISIPAGIAQMNIGVFLLYSAIGMGIWASVLAYLGRLLGENYEVVSQYLGPVSYIVIGLLVLSVIVVIARRHAARGQRQASA